MKQSVLRTDEKITFKLRQLYRDWGYVQYRVGKFEEYDLYMQNKNFLTSEQILTFSDTNGKLMALKPDITLSIIKNTKDEGDTKKLFYSEHVYRVPKNAYGFKEILQTGLECIGEVDSLATAEVLMLAAESLKTISERFVLDVSHVGIVSGLLEAEGLTGSAAAAVLDAVSNKNLHACERSCVHNGVSENGKALLNALITLSGEAEEVAGKLSAFDLPAQSKAALDELLQLSRDVKAYGNYPVNVDFSVVNDMDYYSGIVFKGFVEGVPAGVLSGGRYDNLMSKMGKKSGAIGFAVYLDQLERFMTEQEDYDVDTLILYDGDSDTDTVIAAARVLRAEGRSVRIQCRSGDGIRSRVTLFCAGKEMKEV